MIRNGGSRVLAEGQGSSGTASATPGVVRDITLLCRISLRETATVSVVKAGSKVHSPGKRKHYSVPRGPRLRRFPPARL